MTVGWGVSDVLETLLSREPQRVPVSDLQRMQQRLKKGGYVTPDTPADGIWNPAYSSAFRRFERDAFEEKLSGDDKIGSTSLQTAMRYLGYMTPSGVWQGLIGMARGIKEQAIGTEEESGTLERVGLLGGAAAGAGVGAAVGVAGGPFAPVSVPVGAGVGAIVGGITGLVGDLLGEDEDEDRNKSAFVDALSPFEEYSGEGGVEKFFDDLNAVTTAASIITGVGGAFEAGAAGIQAVRGATAAGKPLGEALLAKTAVGRPGILASALTAKKAPIYGALGGAAIEGFRTGDVEGAIRGGIVGGALGLGGKYASGPIRDFIARNGLMAQHSRPLIKTINGVFTGLATAQFGSRVASDVIPGISEIEKETEEQPLPPWHSTVDWLGLAFYPTQVFPVKGGEIASGIAASKMFRKGSDWAYELATQGLRNAAGERMGLAERVAETRRVLSPSGDPSDLAGIAGIDHNIEVEAGRDVLIEFRLQGLEPGTVKYQEEKARLTGEYAAKVNDERFAMLDGTATESPISDELVSWNYPDESNHHKTPLNKVRFVQRFGTGTGRDIFGGMTEQIKAEGVLGNLQRGFDEGRYAYTFGKGKGDVVIAGSRGKVANPERDVISKSILELEKRIKSINPLTAADPQEAQAIQQEMTAQRDELLKQLETVPQKVEAPVHFAIANVHDPAKGIWGAATQQEIEGTRKTLKGTIDELKSLSGEIKTGDPVAVHRRVGEIINDLTDPESGLLAQLKERDLIHKELFDRAIDGLAMDKVFGERPGFYRLHEIRDHLKTVRHLYGQEVTQLPREIAEVLPETKRVIAVGTPQIRKDTVVRAMYQRNLDEFSRNPNMWDTIGYYASNFGMSPVLHTDEGLGKLRAAAQEASVQDEIRRIEAETGRRIPINGRGFMRDLRDGMRKYQEEANPWWGPLEQHQIKNPTTGEVKTIKRLPILDVRQIRRQQIRDWTSLDKLLPEGVNPDDFSLRMYGALRKGSALNPEMSLANPIDSLRSLGKQFRVDGYPGFVDWMRMWHVKDPRRFMGAVGGVIGGGVGYEQDDFEGLAKGAAIGALLGAAGGQALAKQFPKGTWGYLPDWLHRVSMAARYTFSLAFDLGRWFENATISTMNEDLPFILDAWGHVKRNKQGFKSLMGEGMVYGDDAVADMKLFAEKMHGHREVSHLDDMLQWGFQRGVTGYSPRLQESARAYMAAQRDAAKGVNVLDENYLAKLEQRIRGLEGYGVGRRTWEKSVNFVFFPFSFQKKLLTALGNFITQAPARALMIHEGFRRFHEMGLDENAGEFVDKYLPIAKQLQRLNNLSYGISPGRFFLQGFTDDKTALGKIGQAFGSVFVPSGANTPAAQLFGGLGDAMVHLFSPVVITGESKTQEVFDTFTQFVPAIRDIDRVAIGSRDIAGSAIGQQITALPLVGEGAAPYYQLQHYLDEKRQAKDRWAPVAEALGYASVDSFLSSPKFSAIKVKVDQEINALGTKYPTGFDKANRFENTSAINKQFLYRLANQADRTDAQDVILSLAQMDDSVDDIVAVTGLDTSTVRAIMGKSIRREAMKHADDREFQGLWRQFFEYAFGPIASIKAA